MKKIYSEKITVALAFNGFMKASFVPKHLMAKERKPCGGFMMMRMRSPFPIVAMN
jgi:hypothetical protein